jgi:hypothetical protein
MDASQPTLPMHHAFLVQFRAQSPETPMTREGRVEQVVSGQVTHFHALEELLTFMQQALAGVQRPSGSPETRSMTCSETARGAVATTEM